MAQIQKTGRVFVLVTKQNVGTTNASFADKNVILSDEHCKYKWLSFKKAKNKLVWRGQKKGIKELD